jgi:hypothetical protein
VWSRVCARLDPSHGSSVPHFPLRSYNKRRLEEIAQAFDLLDRSELRADQDLRKRGLAAGTSFNPR